MVKSMTGFGRGSFSLEGEDFFVEVKSLNHRYLDTKIRTPERFFSLENLIKGEIKKRFSRGSFYLTLFSETLVAPELKLNMAAARAYLEAAMELKNSLGVAGEPDLEFLFSQKEVFSAQKKAPALDRQWRSIRKGIAFALEEVEAWRVKEGKSLEMDIKKRCRSIKAMARKIEKRLPGVLASYMERVKAKIERLADERADESKMLLEAAALAEKTDVTEEMVRIKSHLDAFNSYLGLDEPVGKRLDFLAQEIFREANTIASKVSDAAISQTVVEIKNEVEKIREQVQNIE